MKTKALILICLLLGFGVAQLSAQPAPPDNKHGTGTVVGSHVFTDWAWPAFCNDELVDVLIGTIYVQYEAHFYKGNFIFANHHCTGEAVSTSGSGEVFKIIDIPQKYVPGWEYQYDIVNYIGDQGSHYVATLAWENNEPWGLMVIRAVCPGSKK